MKIAVLSNVNIDGTIRFLQRHLDVYMTEGYGNELGSLMNPQSSLWVYEPDIVFIIEDLMELLCHETEENAACLAVEQWFSEFRGVMRDDVIYYLSDAFLRGPEFWVLVDKGKERRLEQLWQIQLENLLTCSNVRIFPYSKLIKKLGEDKAFSAKMWYMGKIVHSMEMQRLLAEGIKHCVFAEENAPKKVLLLDLDNTLWGGLAGENDLSPVELSDEHTGLIYKDLQRVILQMKEQGILLGVVSKNNMDDAVEIIRHHPHMVLREKDFAVLKINWQSKAENIRAIAEELNLGLDSMVFFDDNPYERQLIMEILPEVSVPDFPADIEELPTSMAKIWLQYFDRGRLTEEDTERTEQYAANARRTEFAKGARSFEEYLYGLEIELVSNEPSRHIERILQLFNKTNQFNLTTKRHSMSELQAALKDDAKKLFAYTVRDRFGDNGLVAALLVDFSLDEAVISEFVMSCRVMGKNIENAIVDNVETTLLGMGCKRLIGEFIPSKKNKPVENLYTSLGYRQIASNGECQRYVINLADRQKRNYCLKKLQEENEFYAK